MLEWHVVESSNLFRVRYFRRTRILIVQFIDERIYIYAEVPWAVYMRLLHAKSKGAYHNKFIAYQYNYQEVAAEDARHLGLTA